MNEMYTHIYAFPTSAGQVVTSEVFFLTTAFKRFTPQISVVFGFSFSEKVCNGSICSGCIYTHIYACLQRLLVR